MKTNYYKSTLWVLFLVSSIPLFCQSEIGISTGYYRKINMVDIPNSLPIFRLNSDFIEGMNVGLSYRFNFNSFFRLKNQLKYQSFEQGFFKSTNGHIFSYAKRGTFHFDELHLSVIPQIKLLKKPLIFLGIGFNYLRQLDGSEFKFRMRGRNIKTGELRLYIIKEKHFLLIEPNQFSIPVELEFQQRLGRSLQLAIAVNYQYGLTDYIVDWFDRTDVTFQQVGLDIELLYRFRS